MNDRFGDRNLSGIILSLLWVSLRFTIMLFRRVLSIRFAVS